MQRSLLFLLLLSSGLCSHAEEKLTLSTDDTFLEVVVQDGRPVITALRGKEADGKFNWAHKSSPLPLLDQVYVKGESRAPQWKFVRAEKAGDTRQILHFTSKEPEMELLSIWEARSGPGPVEHHIEIINRSDEAIEVGLQPSL